MTDTLTPRPPSSSSSDTNRLHQTLLCLFIFLSFLFFTFCSLTGNWCHVAGGRTGGTVLWPSDALSHHRLWTFCLLKVNCRFFIVKLDELRPFQPRFFFSLKVMIRTSTGVSVGAVQNQHELTSLLVSSSLSHTEEARVSQSEEKRRIQRGKERS